MKFVQCNILLLFGCFSLVVMQGNKAIVMDKEALGVAYRRQKAHADPDSAFWNGDGDYHRELAVIEAEGQFCINQDVFELAFGANSCQLNCCTTTLYNNSIGYEGQPVYVDETEMTCCFDECGPGLNKHLTTAKYTDPIFGPVAVASCQIEGCGIYDCNEYETKCEDACEVCKGPCTPSFEGCEDHFDDVNDYIRDVVWAFADLDPECFNPECDCVHWYKTGHCTAARESAEAACNNLISLVNWFCPLLEMCGGETGGALTFQDVYDVFAYGRDQWCKEAGIMPTENCQLLTATGATELPTTANAFAVTTAAPGMTTEAGTTAAAAGPTTNEAGAKTTIAAGGLTTVAGTTTNLPVDVPTDPPTSSAGDSPAPTPVSTTIEEEAESPPTSSAAGTHSLFALAVASAVFFGPMLLM